MTIEMEIGGNSHPDILITKDLSDQKYYKNLNG